VHPWDSDGDETFGLERGDNRRESISNCLTVVVVVLALDGF
jgi:hypothetical protein